MFGMNIKPPGSLYWFNASLLFLVVMAMNAMAEGSFPGYFAIAALLSCAICGYRYPYVNAEKVLTGIHGFLSYALVVCVASNMQDHLLHRPVSFTGMLCLPLFSIVGFYLGRYMELNRFSAHPEIDPEVSGASSAG